ncbi:MAG: zinc ribbon domain-containing protein, partial [Clostridia bacterium]|nr:zinc ribbon domain-containing protein [Clostridia bacterium]
KGVKKVVWRCISRLDHGTKYCKDSPTIDEDKLHSAIMSAINTMLDSRDKLRTLLNGSIAEILSAPDTDMEIMTMLSKIDIKNSEMLEIIRQGVENRENREIIQERCRQKHEEIAEIQQSLNSAKTKQQMENSHTNQLREIYDTVSGISGNFTEYDDELVRMAVTKVKILSDTKAQITLFDSIKIDTELI